MVVCARCTALFFFFSSRRRHTRFDCDWSSDVCSSDLVVTSGMIEADADVEVLDKDVYIATVSEGGKLDMEMRLKRGRGYVSADKNFEDDLGLGFIPIDSVHSPVRKVNYTVEAARLGQITDYDKLDIEIWTNGSVKAVDAIGLAAKLLKDHMTIFINFEEELETESRGEEKPDRKSVV